MLSLSCAPSFALFAGMCSHMSACSGALGVLKYLREQGCPWDYKVCDNAAWCGHLHVLKYAHRNGCPWGELQSKESNEVGMFPGNRRGIAGAGLCAGVADLGALDTLMYAHENGCPWDETTCAFAANAGHIHILEYAHANGCPWNEWTCMMAKDMEVLKWAHEHGCPWNERTCEVAAKTGRLDMLTYMHEKGCPWDARTLGAAIAERKNDAAAYARDKGCPPFDDQDAIEAYLGQIVDEDFQKYGEPPYSDVLYGQWLDLMREAGLHRNHPLIPDPNYSHESAAGRGPPRDAEDAVMNNVMNAFYDRQGERELALGAGGACCFSCFDGFGSARGALTSLYYMARLTLRSSAEIVLHRSLPIRMVRTFLRHPRPPLTPPLPSQALHPVRARGRGIRRVRQGGHDGGLRRGSRRRASLSRGDQPRGRPPGPFKAGALTNAFDLGVLVCCARAPHSRAGAAVSRVCRGLARAIPRFANRVELPHALIDDDDGAPRMRHAAVLSLLLRACAALSRGRRGLARDASRDASRTASSSRTSSSKTTLGHSATTTMARRMRARVASSDTLAVSGWRRVSWPCAHALPHPPRVAPHGVTATPKAAPWIKAAPWEAS